MTLTAAAMKGVLSSATKINYLQLITITHSQIGALRFVGDKKDLVRVSGQWKAFPLSVSGPNQDENSAPTIDVTIDIVDRQILLALRQTVGGREKVELTYEVVTAQEPDVTQWGPLTFEIGSVTNDGMARARISVATLFGALNDAFPHQQFGPGSSG